MEEQLEVWRLRIDQLAHEMQRDSAPVGFYTLMHIDELKALHAVAKTNLDEFKAGNDQKRVWLKTGMKRSWDELEVALKKTKP
ncbi:MAG: hypothetical protein Q7W56_04105 [Candidatus Latescibacteria bacterium]|nr:hypothetical protein [Candidatus Latescibacterota bacterium]